MEDAASSLSSPPAEVEASECTFPFNSLPVEIRDVIWEFTLPPARVFHVSGTADRGRNVQPTDPRRTPLPFISAINPPRPRGLGGYIFASSPTRPGLWFNPQRDILYLDRNQRHHLRTKEGKPARHIFGWDRVLHVGIEWRAWFRDVPHRQPGRGMRRDWRAAIQSLYIYMPHLKGIHYILPRVRHIGGVTGGREPYGAAKYPTELVTLPATTSIPWYKTRGAAGNAPAAPGTGAAVLEQMGAPTATTGEGHRPYLATWEHIREDMERSMESDDESDDGREDDEQEEELDWTMVDEFDEYERVNASNRLWRDERPEVVGWWLLRCGASMEKEDPQVRAYLV
ncbi:hypothetical protein PT974_05569 [Cladobotryum mycophilum]|uniref:2EXR domain-containing protein n=1 Tax=Cladobotryum mycophilum TaxID=491253 RepID=A0ABR0SJ25_9HYPO